MSRGCCETVPVPQEAGRREVSCFEEGLRTVFLQSGSRCLGRKWRTQLPAPLGSVAVLIDAAKVNQSQKALSEKWAAELRGRPVVKGDWNKTDTGERPKQIQILRRSGCLASSLHVPLMQHTAPSIWPW